MDERPADDRGRLAGTEILIDESRFGIDRLDQSLEVAVTKSKSLEAVRIIRMTRHVVGTDRSGKRERSYVRCTKAQDLKLIES